LGINRNSIEEYFSIVAEFIDDKRRSGDSRANLLLTQNGHRLHVTTRFN